MDVVVERCAGLDVHRDTVVATVRVPGDDGRGRRQETRTFRTTTAELTALADWLASFGVARVGMEATGVYWKPVYYALEDRFEVWLLNAQHLRNVPGRKSDVADSVWICQLTEHGLVRPSFVPPQPIRELRDLTRYRRSQIEERTRAVQRLEKVLQDAGIKLTSVASSVLTKSGRAMLEAILHGEQDTAVLARLAKGRMRSKIPELEEALRGRFRTEHHGLLITRILTHVDFLDESIEALNARIGELMRPFHTIRQHVMTIPGVKERTADALIAEAGVDMSQFPTAGHLASWAAICPGNNESAGKRKSGKTRRGNPWLRKALTEAAHAAANTKDTYLRSHHRQIRGRKGAAKAIGATRHDILVAYWHIVTNNTDFKDLGPDWLAARSDPEHQKRRLLRQLEGLGYKVTIEAPAA